MPSAPKLISCPKHGDKVPWAVICYHLLKGRPADQWRPLTVEDYREVESDWVCENCYNKYCGTERQTDLLVVICMFCLRELQREVSGMRDDCGDEGLQ